MLTRRRVCIGLLMLAAMAIVGGVAVAHEDEGQKLVWNGTIYTKWLWGNQRDDGSLYNFTTIPGEGYGDNGQGSEFELFLSSRVSSKVSISGRIKARFNQNQWTNFGGFGDQSGAAGCTAGDCGEFDSRSAQYMKFRGAAVTLTPGYKYLHTVVIGSNDWGMFDDFTIGKIRYIDRDNGSGLLFQGSSPDKRFTWDAARISLPRLWAGPNFSTGSYNVQDAAWAIQLQYTPNSMWDVAAIWDYVNDIEVEEFDVNSGDIGLDNGRELDRRYKNIVVGTRFGIHPNDTFDISGRYYSSISETLPADYQLNGGGSAAPQSLGIGSFSPVPAGDLDGDAWRLNLDINDPFDVGLSFQVEAWDFDADFVSLMAARREADVLLTEGFDATWAFPGPGNAAFGIFGGNPSRMGYGGFQGHAQQVISTAVDNEFTDFDEPLAESVAGWKGFTLVPNWNHGDLNLSAEITSIDYNQNWQAWDDRTRAIDDTDYPTNELDSGVGHNFRSSYQPFQEKETDILVLKGEYLVDVGTGLEIFGKLKFIDEQDKRMNDVAFLPYADGDCALDPMAGAGCAGAVRVYGMNAGGTSFDTTTLYGNPGVITVMNPTTGMMVTGYQYEPFNDIGDDDRDMDYTMYQLGAAYQVSDRVHARVTYENYDVDLKDGNTAFQAYRLHEMAGGQHDKNKLIVNLRYSLTGTEFGLNFEHTWGDFTPNFGNAIYDPVDMADPTALDGFVVQYADATTAANALVPLGSPGFAGRFGGWNSLLTRDFRHNRIKAYLKVQF